MPSMVIGRVVQMMWQRVVSAVQSIHKTSREKSLQRRRMLMLPTRSLLN
ncbi:hypothetical protein Ahy_B03g067179 isoform C [Arachis hypogaea]|uniref:Uncharacterized protein n=1 Tax=Arachis hypogaea TaxID=3818 RepID=A0A445A615_ARAHY|nr:hypothetical protein Ahy_B03g067179 isoform C [Arachis hypogaea]